MEREGGNGGKMRKWRKWEEMEGEWGNAESLSLFISTSFPLSLSISSSFPHYLSISSQPGCKAATIRAALIAEAVKKKIEGQCLWWSHWLLLLLGQRILRPKSLWKGSKFFPHLPHIYKIDILQNKKISQKRPALSNGLKKTPSRIWGRHDQLDDQDKGQMIDW